MTVVDIVELMSSRTKETTNVVKDGEGHYGYQHLTCAGCGSEWVHCSGVLERARDEDGTPEITNTTGMAESEIPEFGNTRRSTWSITYWCENCHAISRLYIKNHKGNVHLMADVVGSHQEEQDYDEPTRTKEQEFIDAFVVGSPPLGYKPPKSGVDLNAFSGSHYGVGDVEYDRPSMHPPLTVPTAVE